MQNIFSAVHSIKNTMYQYAMSTIFLIDSHCHPQFPQYNSDRDEVIKNSLNESIGLICVGTNLETSRQGIELAEKYNGIWATVGIHPNDLENWNLESGIWSYENLLEKSEKITAIGEVGLDYYGTKEPGLRDLQKQVFSDFIDLAIKYSKPLIVHSRDAFEDTIMILNSKFQILNSGLKGVIHSFTYSFDQAQKFFDLGFYIGLNGIITFTEQYNDTVKNAPLDKILLETDAPFLSPVPHRGQRNEPVYIKFVAEHIAKVRGTSVEEVNQTTLENTKKLFGIT